MWLLPDCSPAAFQKRHAEPGDRTPATEIQSGQSSTIPYNPLSRRRTPQAIGNTHCTCHTHNELIDSWGDRNMHIIQLTSSEMGKAVLGWWGGAT